MSKILFLSLLMTVLTTGSLSFAELPDEPAEEASTEATHGGGANCCTANLDSENHAVNRMSEQERIAGILNKENDKASGSGSSEGTK